MKYILELDIEQLKVLDELLEKVCSNSLNLNLSSIRFKTVNLLKERSND